VSLLDLCLTSSNYIIDFASNSFNLVLSVETSSHFFVSLNETFELFLETVILIVQVCHVFIQGVNLSLQLDLVSVHLIRMLLDSVNLKAEATFVLV
jgi:hypothetical protein